MSGNEGNTPMFMEALAGNIENLKSLARSGADVNARNYNGETPLFMAAASKNKESIQCLVDLGANVNAKDNDGHTPLFQAVNESRIDNIKCLVSLGADIEAKNNNGQTAIFMAAVSEVNPIASMQCLKELGAKLDVKDNDGQTAQELAVKLGETKVAEWLYTNIKAQKEKTDADLIITKYEAKLRDNPNDAEAYQWRGQAYSQKREYDKAIEDFNAVLRLTPDNADIFLFRAMAYSQKKKYGKAIADFDNAIRLNPECVTAYIGKGAIYSDRKEYGKSILNYEKVLQLDQNNKYGATSLLENARNLKEEADRKLRHKIVHLSPVFLAIFALIMGIVCIVWGNWLSSSFYLYVTCYFVIAFLISFFCKGLKKKIVALCFALYLVVNGEIFENFLNSTGIFMCISFIAACILAMIFPKNKY